MWRGHPRLKNGAAFAYIGAEENRAPGPKIESQEQYMASKKKTTKRLKKSQKLEPSKPLTVSVNFTKVEQ
jgi:hypothetical protein